MPGVNVAGRDAHRRARAPGDRSRSSSSSTPRGRMIPVTVSIGLAERGDDGDAARALPARRPGALPRQGGRPQPRQRRRGVANPARFSPRRHQHRVEREAPVGRDLDHGGPPSGKPSNRAPCTNLSVIDGNVPISNSRQIRQLGSTASASRTIGLASSTRPASASRHGATDDQQAVAETGLRRLRTTTPLRRSAPRRSPPRRARRKLHKPRDRKD